MYIEIKVGHIFTGIHVQNIFLFIIMIKWNFFIIILKKKEINIENIINAS